MRELVELGISWIWMGLESARSSYAKLQGQDSRRSTGCQFNFAHAAIRREDSKRFLDRAFRRDFERNGPSLFRICRITFEGWQRYRNDTDPRVRERFAREIRSLKTIYSGVLWAMERQQRRTGETMSAQIALRKQMGPEFGVVSRAMAGLLALYCCGPAGGNRSSWPAERRTSRGRSPSAGTGPGRDGGLDQASSSCAETVCFRLAPCRQYEISLVQGRSLLASAPKYL